uniref:Putative Pi-transporter-like B1 n=1 Tax=Magnetospirillum gryphiswaldense TaxID=55518 RepID=Q5D4Z3_9PROT|nr:putative Pi-transporter-like B1 [Magnetospirillum gryphiswaldense]
MVIGYRQRHGHLAIVLLAKLAAILPGHAHRVDALLGKAGVVDDPGAQFDVPLDGRKHRRPHRRQHRLVRPVGLGDEVMHRLVRRLHAPRLHPRRHRLDALAVARQHQTQAIRPQWRRPVGMANCAAKVLDIRLKSRFTVARHSMETHAHPLSSRPNLHSYHNLIYDAVELGLEDDGRVFPLGFFWGGRVKNVGSGILASRALSASGEGTSFSGPIFVSCRCRRRDRRGVRQPGERNRMPMSLVGADESLL